MYAKTKNAMIEYAQKLKASADRAQCYRIASYKIQENGIKRTIAEILDNDHRSEDGALRAASLMVLAGCAKEINKKNEYCYGTFIFEDGSTLN